MKDRKALLPFLMFISFLGLHFFVSTIGWNNPLTDRHMWRQTHNAISVYWLMKEGYTVDYQTPVFGAPWSIPREFPLYHASVAFIANTFHMNLESAGRAISLLFFYFTLPVLYFLLKQLSIKKSYRFLILSMVLTNPIYLYWPRTFMSESTALFFSVCFILCAVLSTKFPRSYRYVIAAIIVGALAGLAKTTTFLVALIPTSLYFCYVFVKSPRTDISKKIIKVLITIGIPLLISYIWVWYSDLLKAQNPLAKDFITSYALQEVVWTFGTLKQKLSVFTWVWLLNSSNQIFSNLILFIVAVSFIKLQKNQSTLYRWIFLGTYIGSLLIFTNVYYVHDYYFYANTIYLVIAAGLAFIHILENYITQPLLRYVFVVLVFLFQLNTYRYVYLPYQLQNDSTPVEVGHAIEKYTKEGDVILIYGHDWNPAIPYFSKRKAIMDRWNYPLDNPAIQKSIQYTGKEKIAAMFVLQKDKQFVQERITYFGFQPTPISSSKLGDLYIK